MTFDPDRPLTDDIRIVENAMIVPFGAGEVQGIARPAGVADSSGTWLDLGRCWRAPDRAVTFSPEASVDPAPDTDQMETIAGTWIYGGMLYHHFGHFLLESTSRLWVRGALDLRMKGELFLPKTRVLRPNRFVRPLRPMLEAFGARPKRSAALIRPARVERLVMAPQGFGTGEMIAGCPEYRRIMRRRLGRKIVPDGAERIYISRSRLFARRGRYLGEARIERLLAEAGYRIFHPQEQSFAAQIAQYKAARVILSSDSSALHLAAFFARPGDRVAIVLRRPGDIVNDYQTQFRQFAGVEPDVIDALNGRLHQSGISATGTMNEVFSELDFPRLGRTLVDLGYLSDASGWTAQPADEIAAECADLARRLNAAVLQIG